MGLQITRDDLARMYPRARTDWLDALSQLATPLCEHYGFNRLDWCGIAGQIDAECDGLALPRMEEDMRFTADRMLKVYSKRLGDCVGIPVPPLGGRVFASKGALARALAGKPKELADVVYGGPHGREGTPPWQGSHYLGRGPLQETHRNNYAAAYAEICKQPGGTSCPSLLDQPELLATDPELGVRDVFGQWRVKGLSKYAQRKDWATLSDVLNTGNPNDNVKPFGLDRRLRATARALAIWPEPIAGATEEAASGVSGLRQGDKGGEVKRLQERLAELGFATGPADGVFGVLTARALTAFQAEHGLKVDGIAGPRTLEVMAASAKAPGPHNDIGPKDLPKSTTLHALKWGRRTVNAGLTFLGLNEVDNQAGLGLVDAAVSKVEQTKGLAERISALGIGLPSAHAVSLLAALGAGAALLYFINRAEFGRVLAARKGG